jgi:hypothetical protein
MRSPLPEKSLILIRASRRDSGGIHNGGAPGRYT